MVTRSGTAFGEFPPSVVFTYCKSTQDELYNSTYNHFEKLEYFLNILSFFSFNLTSIPGPERSIQYSKIFFHFPLHKNLIFEKIKKFSISRPTTICKWLHVCSRKYYQIFLERCIMNMFVGYIHIFFYEFVYVSAIFNNRYMSLKQHELCHHKSFTRNVIFKIKNYHNFNSEKTKV